MTEQKYRCYLCSKPSDGLLCEQCRSEIDRGDFDRVVNLSGLKDRTVEESGEKDEPKK